MKYTAGVKRPYDVVWSLRWSSSAKNAHSHRDRTAKHVERRRRVITTYAELLAGQTLALSIGRGGRLVPKCRVQPRSARVSTGRLATVFGVCSHAHVDKGDTRRKQLNTKPERAE